MKRTETITRTTVLLSIISSSSNKYSIAEDGFSFVHGTRRMQTRRTGASGTGEQAGQAVGIFQPFFLQVHGGKVFREGKRAFSHSTLVE